MGRRGWARRAAALAMITAFAVPSMARGKTIKIGVVYDLT